MTNRNSRAEYNWATDPFSDVVDPDDDASHPSGEGGNNKYIRGWKSEVEPHEWRNYVWKRKEDLELQKLENGWELEQSTVFYKFGAVAWAYGMPQMYITTTEFVNPIIDQDGVTTLYSQYNEYLQQEGAYAGTQAAQDWTPILAWKKSDYDAITDGMRSSYNAHTPQAASNPHQDNITAIGGYTKAEIDSDLAEVTSDLDSHVLDHGNPHIETCAQLGTLPTSGGEFTGQVNYLWDVTPFGDFVETPTTETLSLNFLYDNYAVYERPEGEQDGRISFDDTKFFISKNGRGAIGVGLADYSSGGLWAKILTTGNYYSVSSVYNAFTLVPPHDVDAIMKTDLKSNSHTITFSRPSTLAYTDRMGQAQVAAANEPAFELTGLKLTADTTITISGTNLLGASEGTVSYVLNDVLYTQDVHFLSNELTYYFGKAGNVRCFKYWVKRLRLGQKINIPS